MRSFKPESTVLLRQQAGRVLDAVAQLPDPELETLVLREAALLERPHAPDRTRELLQRALSITEDHKDLRGQAQILRNLARRGVSSGAQRLGYGRQAVAAARLAGEASVLVYALLTLAIVLEEEDDDLVLAAAAADEAFTMAGDAGMDGHALRCGLPARIYSSGRRRLPGGGPDGTVGAGPRCADR